MNRRLCGLLCVAIVLYTHAIGLAADPLHRIGFLSQCSRPHAREPLEQGLHEVGYVEGRNVTILWRELLDDPAQLAPAARELVSAPVDVIVTCSTAATRAAREATRSIPIVFTGIADPIASGLAASLGHPGGNATGISVLVPDLYPKRLDLLLQVASRIKRAAFIVNLSSPGSALALEPLQAAAKAHNLQLDVYNTQNAEEVAAALRSLAAKPVGGVLVGGDLVVYREGARIAEWARKARVPAIFPWRQFHDYGVLMSYGPDPAQIMRRAAWYVDKILKGTAPADLPIEQVTKMDLVLNERVARESGIRISPELRYRADEILQ